MRLFICLLGLLGAVALSACNSAEQKNSNGPLASASPVASPPNDGVRRVTTTELQDLVAKNQAFVVDVRNEASYNAGHIRGAKLIPEADIPNHLSELPKDKLIVTYCSWPAEHTSARAVVDLRGKGINNAAALLGGYAAWQNAGLPIDKKE